MKKMNPKHHKRRNFVKKKALHVVLSTPYRVLYGPRVQQVVDKLLAHYGKYFGVKVYHRALVGSHIHLIILPNSSEALSGFLRVVSGQIASHMKRLKLIPKELKGFWRQRPWSELLNWGRHYTIATKYVALNYLEGIRRVIRKKNQNELQIYAAFIQEVLDQQLTALPL